MRQYATLHYTSTNYTGTAWWHNSYDVGLLTKLSWVRLPVGSLQVTTLGKLFSCSCDSGKVTVGLALHQPWILYLVVYPPTDSMAYKGSWALHLRSGGAWHALPFYLHKSTGKAGTATFQVNLGKPPCCVDREVGLPRYYSLYSNIVRKQVRCILDGPYGDDDEADEEDCSNVWYCSEAESDGSCIPNTPHRVITGNIRENWTHRFRIRTALATTQLVVTVHRPIRPCLQQEAGALKKSEILTRLYSHATHLPQRLATRATPWYHITIVQQTDTFSTSDAASIVRKSHQRQSGTHGHITVDLPISSALLNVT